MALRRTSYVGLWILSEAAGLALLEGTGWAGYAPPPALLLWALIGSALAAGWVGRREREACWAAAILAAAGIPPASRLVDDPSAVLLLRVVLGISALWGAAWAYRYRSAPGGDPSGR